MVWLGVDLGNARVGLALSDPELTFAHPAGNIHVAGDYFFAIDEVLNVIEDEHVDHVIVGLPLQMDGTEGKSAKKARRWAANLEKRLQAESEDSDSTEYQIPQVSLIDERLTTVSAHRQLFEAHKASNKHRPVVDQQSAVVICRRHSTVPGSSEVSVMTDDFNEFFDDNTHWVEQGSEPMRGAEPPEPPKSRREMRKRRAQRRRKRISGIIIAIAIVALLIGGGYFGVTKLIAWRDSRSNQSTAIADYPGPGYGEVEFTVSEGQGAAEIADNLLKAEVIKSTAAFTSVVNANSTTLYPGTFTLKKHMAASKVIDVLSDTNQAAGFLEVRPGERATDVFANAAKLSGIAQSEFDTIIKNKGKDILPNEAGGSFEGWLEPGTYNVKSMKSASEILKAMVDKRIAKLDELGVPAGSDRERVMIIASIAEAEVNKADYYGKVTRVIENRLEQGMSLGMDSTVAYGNNVKPAQVTTEMTQDESNPYNTYKISGLPPTPISNPGDNAIQAALHPEGGNWLYFCTVNLDTGETKFAATADEHDQNVAELRKWQAENQ